MEDKPKCIVCGEPMRLLDEDIQRWYCYKDDQAYFARENRWYPSKELDRKGVKQHGVIGSYKISDILGSGGFGVVYLATARDPLSGLFSPYALKTLKNEYLLNESMRERLRRIAELSINMDTHPYVVRVDHLNEIDGQLYIAMEYLSPNIIRTKGTNIGLYTLGDHLSNTALSLAQALRWSIHACLGLEYAYAKGVRCHGDIKPSNILIDRDRLAKVSDFGWNFYEGNEDSVATSAGTPTHMPPEQFEDPASVDPRTDIYALGVVLYQMINGGKPPFMCSIPKDDSIGEKLRFWKEMHALQAHSPIPMINSTVFPVIQRCLEKERNRRYADVKALREDLEILFKHVANETVKPPPPTILQAMELNNKGLSLDILGKIDEAMRCYDKALQLEPTNPLLLTNRGKSLSKLNRTDEAMNCYERALSARPGSVFALDAKGTLLAKQSRLEEAISTFDKAIEIEPRDTHLYGKKAQCLHRLNRIEDSIKCLDEILKVKPDDAATLYTKGIGLVMLNRYPEAILCFDEVLKNDSRNAKAWKGKAFSLFTLHHYDESIACYDKLLEIDPTHADVWYPKGLSAHELGRKSDAALFFEKFLNSIDSEYATTHPKEILFAAKYIEDVRGSYEGPTRWAKYRKPS